MKHLNSISFSILTSILLLISCQNPISELSKEFSCDNVTKLENLETVSDFKNIFSVEVPKHWNTKLYYDDNQSEIFSADTIKNLSDSYIMDFSVVLNNLEINKKLQEKVLQKAMDNNLKTLKESFHNFKGNKAYAHLGLGSSKGMDLYVFQYYFKLNEEKYMLIKTEFYGKEGFDNRFCESVSLIEKISIK